MNDPKPLVESIDGPVRTALLLSGSGSNAVKIIAREMTYRKAGETPPYEVVLLVTDNENSNAPKIAVQFKKKFIEINLQDYLAVMGADIKDMDARAEYDRVIQSELDREGVQMNGLAGWEWVVTDHILKGRPTANVHPGNLRTRKDDGKRAYIGLGWVPSAKAILAGEGYVNTSVHMVTEELDGGPLAMVSEPVEVDTHGIPRDALLPSGMTLRKLMKERRLHGESRLEETLLEKVAGTHQELLKTHGDWVCFPLVMELLASGRIQKDELGLLYFDNQPIPKGLDYTQELELRR